MADPVLLFQLPEIDVRLQKKRKLCIKLVQDKTFTLGVFSTVNLRQIGVDEILRRKLRYSINMAADRYIVSGFFVCFKRVSQV